MREYMRRPVASPLITEPLSSKPSTFCWHHERNAWVHPYMAWLPLELYVSDKMMCVSAA